jgi:peroxiredoxin
MIRSGDDAPGFELPAVEGGEFGVVALDDYLGDDIVILAFYPADFNPCCDGASTDLDELDLFTMQKDVSIVGLSADSVYSHRAFAAEYDLHIPLLADVHGEVAEAYGVAVEERAAGYRTNRAVVVVDPDGEVQYAWQTDDLQELPPVDDVREAVEGVGGGDTAEARYRVGHAHYVEGRRAFTSAMGEFGELEWMLARGDFTRAREEFEEAAGRFNTAVRFAEDERPRTYFERAEEKAAALAQAAEWLAEGASAYASGEGARGEEMRADAERPLETARDIHEPPDPDDFPPEEDPAEREDSGTESILPTEDDGATASLETDIDEAIAGVPSADGESEDDTAGDAGTGPEAPPAAGETAAAGDGDQAADPNTGDAGDGEADDEIDDDELEEIAAELEAQTERAQAERAAESDATPSGDGPDGPDEADESVAEDLTEEGTLDLADPTDGEEGDDDDESAEYESGELQSGDHGVPDSL